jgi:intracellular septation protein
MKILNEFLPILAFFIAYKFGGIYAATGVAIGITVLQMLWLVLQKKPISKMQYVNFFIILIFGGLTILLHDKEFIMLKPTVLYWTFAISLAVSFYVFKKNLIQMVLGKEIVLDAVEPNAIWAKLNIAWIIYFACLGFLNLYIAKSYPEDTWVNFKLSTIGLLLAFIVLQGLWLSKYLKSDNT